MDVQIFTVELSGKTTVLSCFLATIIVLLAVRRTVQQVRFRDFAVSHGCRKPASYMPYDPVGLIPGIQIALTAKRRAILPWTHQLFTLYNSTFACRIFFQDLIFTCHPRNIKHIMNTQFGDFTAANERTHLFADFSARGVLTLDGAAWVTAREQLRRPFAISSQRFVGEFEMWERHIQRFLLTLPAKAVNVDLQELMPCLVMDVLSEFLLGESLDTLESNQASEKRDVSDALMLSKNCIAKKGFAGPFHWMIGGATFSAACVTFQQYLQKFARRALLKAENRSRDRKDDISDISFIEALAIEEKDELVLRDQVSNIIIAGDATAALISATMWLLARNQQVCVRLRQDVTSTCGLEPPNSAMIKNMTYLRCTINESLRLFPPVTFDMRTANKDITLPVGGGPSGQLPIAIRKGQNIVFSSYSTHRCTDIYGADAKDFRPERWENIKANTAGFLPFHIGPRSCPGQQYAIALASYVIVRLLQSFEKIESKDDGEWVEDISMTLGNHRGVVVSLFQK